MESGLHYSLWLVPPRDSDLFARLRRIIDDLASLYDTTPFDPHATLLGGVGKNEAHARALTAAIAQGLMLYQIELGEIGSQDAFYRRLFATIVPSEEVMRANALAQLLAEVEQGAYFPHASLAYGNFTDHHLGHLRQRLAGHPPLQGVRFPVDRIELWRTELKLGPKEWRLVETFPLCK